MLPACSRCPAGASWAAPRAKARLEDTLALQGTPTQPLDRPQGVPLQGCPSSTGGRPWTNTVPTTPLQQLWKSPSPTPIFIESFYTNL